MIAERRERIAAAVAAGAGAATSSSSGKHQQVVITATTTTAATTTTSAVGASTSTASMPTTAAVIKPEITLPSGFPFDDNYLLHVEDQDGFLLKLKKFNRAFKNYRALQGSSSSSLPAGSTTKQKQNSTASMLTAFPANSLQELLFHCLHFDPADRITAAQALELLSTISEKVAKKV